LLRIEDIDRSRARDTWEQQIYDDLSWLGLQWDAPPIRQSDHLARYRSALNELWCSGYLYPCECRRADIAAAVNAPQEGAPLLGPDGVIYPRLCYVPTTHHSRVADDMPSDAVLRLDMTAAVAALEVDKTPITYTNNGADRSNHRRPSLLTLSAMSSWRGGIWEHPIIFPCWSMTQRKASRMLSAARILKAPQPSCGFATFT
jgi:glutamyl-Q tRNA(Asp) synthetase